MSLNIDDILGIGSGRFAIDLHNGYVAKIAYSGYGRKANEHELENYNNLTDKNLVAKTEYFNNSIILQEKLTNCITLPWKTADQDVPEYLQHLNAVRLNNRLQAGKDINGNWKIFDYEITYITEVGQENWRKPPTKEQLIAEYKLNPDWQINMLNQ